MLRVRKQRAQLNNTDALNFTLTLDNDLAEELKHLDPHKSCFELDAPRTISGNLSIPKTVVGTISNWLHFEEPDNTPTDFMKSIAIG